jgi:hypothetical protein
MEIEKEILQAESECVGPLNSPREHQRHAVFDFFVTLQKDGEGDANDEKLTFLSEAEGHLYSAKIYCWEEVAARELALTRKLLEQTRVKKYAAAAEKYNYATQKFNSGRNARVQPQTAANFFKECSVFCREARAIAEPITFRDDIALWITAGGFIIALITLGLKMFGVF